MLTSGGRKIWTVADSLPWKRKTGFLPGRSRRTISMAILHKIRNSIQKERLTNLPLTLKTAGKGILTHHRIQDIEPGTDFLSVIHCPIS